MTNNKFKAWLLKNWLTIITLISIALGVGIGLILKNYTRQPWSKREIMYFQFPGEIFFRMVNCLILPLIVSSIVSATSNLSKSGSIGIRAFYYYIVTTTLGVILSVTLGQTVRPGEWHSSENLTFAESIQSFVTADTLLDLLRISTCIAINLYFYISEPILDSQLVICSKYIISLMHQVITVEYLILLGLDNLLKACLAQYHTSLKEPENKTAVPVSEWEIQSEDTDGTNVLGLAFFSLLLGVTLGKMGPEGKPVLEIFRIFSKIMMMIMNQIVLIAPIAVLFLIPGKILSIEDFTVIVAQLGMYVLTVFFGLIFHGLITLPLVYYICTRHSPFKILSKIGPAIVTAFGTSSSTATVPMTIQCLDKIGIDPKVSRFVAPIGATINMDGIALYEALGAIFIIQLRGLNFSLARIIAISVTCTVSCIGAAGLPSGGYVMLVMVLNSIGVPAEDVMLIVAIDSLVDRFRTTINIIGDALGAGIIAYHMKDDLEHVALEQGTSDAGAKLLSENQDIDISLEKLKKEDFKSVVK